MGSTPTYLLPYPELTDPADVPLDVKELADRLEAVFGPGSANGQVPVWDNAAKKWVAALPPGAELGYGQKTTVTNLLSAQGSEATALIICSTPSITLDGSTPILLEAGAVFQVGAQAGSGVIAQFWDGATSLGHFAYVNTGTASALSAPGYGQRRLTPSAGAHTFHFKAYQLGTVGTVVTGGSGVSGQYTPAFIRATKI